MQALLAAPPVAQETDPEIRRRSRLCLSALAHATRRLHLAGVGVTDIGTRTGIHILPRLPLVPSQQTIVHRLRPMYAPATGAQARAAAQGTVPPLPTVTLAGVTGRRQIRAPMSRLRHRCGWPIR